MNSKEQWISEIENSLNGMKRVEPNPYLYSKILNRLEHSSESFTPKKWLWLSVSAMLLLALLNVIFITQVNTSSASSSSDIEIISNHYNLIHPSLLNYN